LLAENFDLLGMDNRDNRVHRLKKARSSTKVSVYPRITEQGVQTSPLRSGVMPVGASPVLSNGHPQAPDPFGQTTE